MFCEIDELFPQLSVKTQVLVIPSKSPLQLVAPLSDSLKVPIILLLQLSVAVNVGAVGTSSIH